MTAQWITDSDWMDDAACRKYPLSYFDFEIEEGSAPRKEKNRAVRRALNICSNCPVLEPCIRWAEKYEWRNTVVAAQRFDERGNRRVSSRD